MVYGFEPMTLFSAITGRTSVRSYDGRPLSREHHDSLAAASLLWSDPEKGIRFRVVRDAGDRVFLGLFGSYGRITGSRDILVMVAEADNPRSVAALGRAGEMLVLAATSLGLGTCWICGSFDPGRLADDVPLNPGEKILAVSPLGYRADPNFGQALMKRLAGSHKRKGLPELMAPGSGPVNGLGDWALRALEVARLAPSAINRQPWRFRVGPDSVTVLDASGKGNGFPSRLDCGICMAHIELAVTAFGMKGAWTYGEAPEVATLTLSGRG